MSTPLTTTSLKKSLDSGGLLIDSLGSNQINGTPIGVKAQSPTAHISPPANTIPAAQTAPRDMSGTYANIGGTLYNKNSQTKFSNAQDFYKDSGLSDFKNVKFDTNYTPTGKETIYGQNPAISNGQSFGFMDGKKYDASGKPIVASQQTTNTTNSVGGNTSPAGLYTPPNQGTTGVNQGGIIGNLITMGNAPSQEYNQAKSYANSVLQKQGQLGQDYAQATQGIYAGGAGDLSLAGGRAGLLNQLYAAKNAALASQYAGATNMLSAANTQQGLRQGATQSAGQLNAPIVNPLTNQLVSPSSNSTTGSTTSGAPLASMVGSRSNMDVYGIGTKTGADGKTTAFYDKATNQVFSTPQALADFINSKNPGAGATAANVFDLLKHDEYFNKSTNQGFATPQALADFVNQQNGNNNANAGNVFGMLGGGAASGPVQPNDPFYPTLVTAANLLATNQIDAANQIMGSMTPAVKAQVYQIAQSQGYNSNVAAGAAQAQQQNTFQSGTAQQQAAYNNYLNANPQYVKLKQAMGEVDGLGTLTMENALHNQINMFSPTLVNEKVADVRRMLSSTGQATFDSNITRLAIAIQNLYAASGGQTPSSIVDAANHIIDPNLQLGALQAQLNAAKAEANVQLNTIANTVAQQYGVVQNPSGGGGGNSNYNW